MAASRRVPELRPKLLGGRALPAARSMRLGVTDDGAVALTDASGRERRLLAPGAVARALHIEYDDARSFLPGRASSDVLLVLLDPAGVPLLAVGLTDWAPPAFTGGAEWRAVTGAPAFAAALGLPLEPAEPGDLEALAGVREVLLRPQPAPPWPGRWGPAICAIALFLGVLGVIGENTWPTALTTVLQILLIAPVVVSGVRSRAQARAPGPTPGRATRRVLRPRPRGPVVRGLAEATLEISDDEVVLTDRGREVWLPGPSRGGVQQVVLAPQSLRLLDAVGNEYVSLDPGLWAPTDGSRGDLARELREAGLDALVAPVGERVIFGVASLPSASVDPSFLLSVTERGEATETTAWLSGLATAVAAGTSIVTMHWNGPLGAVLLVTSLALLGLRLSDTLRRRLGDRRAMRTVEEVPPR